MARIKIQTRDERDPSGNIVDIYPEIELVRMIIFENSQGRPVLSLLPRIIDVLVKIRESSKKRIRERDFPIWGGLSTNRLGMRLLSIALPDPFDYQVFSKFYEEF